MVPDRGGAIDDIAVETAGHEVRPTAFLEQAAGRHANTRGTRHQVVGILDAPVVGAAAQFRVVADTIELEQPVFEAGGGVELPAADFLAQWIPGDDRLGACAAGRRADADDVGERGLCLDVAGQVGVDDLACGFDQTLHRQRFGALAVGAARRLELERTHAAPAHVGQAVEGGDGAPLDAARAHPGVDQGVAEIVRQGIGEQTGEASVAGFGQFGEGKTRAWIAHGHGQRRQVDAAASPGGVIGEHIAAEALIGRDRADALAPDANFDDRGVHPLSVGRRRARCAGLDWRSRSSGLTLVSGARRSIPCSESSAFRTRSSVSTVDPRPVSRLRRAFSEMPAFSAVVR